MTDGAPRNLDVPPTRLRGPRGGGRAGVLALAAVAIIVAGAVGLAQLAPAPGDKPRSSSAAVESAAAEPVPARTPDPSAVIAGTTPRLPRVDLESAVRDGALDGRLVFVDGVLDVAPVRCQSLAQGSGGCVDLAIPGLGLPVWQGEDATPWRTDPPPGAWLVTVARSGGLVYLGSLLPRPGGPDAARDLASSSRPEDEGLLVEADGYLVQHPLHPCVRPNGTATPCPPPSPFLADDAPLPEGIRVSDAGVEVSLAPGAPGIDPDGVVVAGTFLVLRERPARGGVRVVARYEPARSVRVLVP